MNPEIEMAKDQLWKFQLRREHTQLLKDMDKHKEAFTTFAEEAKTAQEQLKEQITGLKFKFEELANENDRQAQEAIHHRRAIDEKIAKIVNIQADFRAWGAPFSANERRENILVETTSLPSTPTPACKVHTTAPTKVSTTSPSRPTSPHSATSGTSKPAHNIANTGLRKSRRQARREPSPQAPPTYAKFPEPPLSQHDLAFADYFTAMDKIAPTIDPEKLTPLAAMFITGLAERERQDAIVDGLEQKELCKVLGDGQVEMKCKWEDLKAVLKALGLLAAPEKRRSHKKGKK